MVHLVIASILLLPALALGQSDTDDGRMIVHVETEAGGFTCDCGPVGPCETSDPDCATCPACTAGCEAGLDERIGPYICHCTLDPGDEGEPRAEEPSGEVEERPATVEDSEVQRARCGHKQPGIPVPQNVDDSCPAWSDAAHCLGSECPACADLAAGGGGPYQCWCPRTPEEYSFDPRCYDCQDCKVHAYHWWIEDGGLQSILLIPSPTMLIPVPTSRADWALFLGETLHDIYLADQPFGVGPAIIRSGCEK